MNSHGRVTDSCLRCAFDSQAQTLRPDVTPQAGPGDRNFQREVIVVRVGGGRGGREGGGGGGEGKGRGGLGVRGGGGTTTVTVSIHQEAQG